MDKADILGVKITKITKKEAVEKVKEFLFDYRQHTVFTPNPEMIVLAQKDKEFKQILNRACLSLPDGGGLVLISRILRNSLQEKIAGVDFVIDIIRLAENKKQSVYFLGGENPKIAAELALKLKNEFPNLKIVGANDGGKINENGEGERDEETIKLINEARPDILFVAFGHGKQEKWIFKNLEEMPSVKIATGVGGAFNFLAGEIKRAPRILRQLNLEWFWRLILEPKRFRRIFNATIIFPYLVLKNAILRRHNANSC
jgi:N-acetylglucosaminyldiphosphoundecaprenol N-acetyl-beta-D-mannosaminyltransferase